jgi:hypothetical protein
LTSRALPGSVNCRWSWISTSPPVSQSAIPFHRRAPLHYSRPGLRATQRYRLASADLAV